jgi:hypothetical protein
VPICQRQGQRRKLLLSDSVAFAGQHHQVGMLDTYPAVALLDEVQPVLGEDYAERVPRGVMGVAAHLWREHAKTKSPTLGRGQGNNYPGVAQLVTFRSPAEASTSRRFQPTYRIRNPQHLELLRLGLYAPGDFRLAVESPVLLAFL